MTQETKGFHHFHKRIRESAESPFTRVIDKLVYVAGLSSIIFTIPQVYVIWVQQTAAGVSLVSWSAYTAGASVWFTYGWVHKERPIIMTYACFFVLNLAVVLGVLRYG